MTLEPHINKYTRYFDNIRIIQDYLSEQAEVFGIPKIDNTNVDRTIAILHQIIFAILKSRLSHRNTSDVLLGEFSKVYAKCMGSKEALSIIRERGSRKRSSSETRLPSAQTDTGIKFMSSLSPPIRTNSIDDAKNDNHSISLIKQRQKEILLLLSSHTYDRHQCILPLSTENIPQEYGSASASFPCHYNDILMQGNSISPEDDDIASLGS